VPERDYAKLTVGQQATLTTDSVPGETFSAQIARIAPVFREASRQARIELRVANPKQLLKPGAFARIQIVLGSAEAAFIVPSAAITRRADQDVIFVVGDDETTVSMRAVHTGLGEGDRVQISPADGESVSGRVVVLGQELLGKASTVRIVNGHEDAAPGNEHEQGR
jgi:RND family efflux transporter MFP subunit